MEIGMSEKQPRGSTEPATRRAILGGAALLGVFAPGGLRAQPKPAMAVQPSRPETRALTSLHQEIAIEAPPAKIYQALLSSKLFTAFSGAPATIDPKVGGAFSLFGGQVVGRNVELVANKRIVQAWRPLGDFPDGVYTLVKFELTPKGKGTLLVLDHTGFPPGHYDHLYAGWGEHYWVPLKKFLA
jgi:activator of HSP90 ATPase